MGILTSTVIKFETDSTIQGIILFSKGGRELVQIVLIVWTSEILGNLRSVPG